MTAAQLKAEIDARRARLAPLIAELQALESQHCDALSREWIAANGVTAAQVQLSADAELPYFGDVLHFGQWMKAAGCTRRWCEWNDRIYSSAEIMAGRMQRDAPGLVEHLPA